MIAAVAQTGVGGYVILYLVVAASWIGMQIIGAGVLAAAGVLASDGELNIWIVIVVATVVAWTGGYVGCRLGLRAGDAVADRPGPLPHQRRRAMISGERIYRSWGRLAVFLTPTFISGAMETHRTLLIWNALAAIASTCVAALGAYGIGAALLGQRPAKRGVLALAVAALPLAALLALIRHADTRIESRGVGLELHRMAIPSYRAAPTPRMLRFSV